MAYWAKNVCEFAWARGGSGLRVFGFALYLFELVFDLFGAGGCSWADFCDFWDAVSLEGVFWLLLVRVVTGTLYLGFYLPRFFGVVVLGEYLV